MSAAIRKAALLAAFTVVVCLAGCAVEPAPYTGAVYAEGPSVFVEPYDHYGYYHYGFYGHPYYGRGFREGGGMHGRG